MNTTIDYFSLGKPCISVHRNGHWHKHYKVSHYSLWRIFNLLRSKGWTITALWDGWRATPPTVESK